MRDFDRHWRRQLEDPELREAYDGMCAEYEVAAKLEEAEAQLRAGAACAPLEDVIARQRKRVREGG